jgi:hypothetical protein
MKNIIIKTALLLILGLSNSAFSFTLETRWNYKFEKETVLSCRSEDFLCQDICQKDKCVKKETICRDCIGSSIYLTHFFTQIGKSIVKSDEAMVEDLRDLILDEGFVTIDARSIYNHVTAFNDLEIRTKLKSLCLPLIDEQPVVVLKTNKGSKLIQKALFVVCKSGETSTVFHLDNNGGVEVNF